MLIFRVQWKDWLLLLLVIIGALAGVAVKYLGVNKLHLGKTQFLTPVAPLDEQLPAE